MKKKNWRSNKTFCVLSLTVFPTTFLWPPYFTVIDVIFSFFLPSFLSFHQTPAPVGIHILARFFLSNSCLKSLGNWTYYCSCPASFSYPWQPYRVHRGRAVGKSWALTDFLFLLRYTWHKNEASLASASLFLLTPISSVKLFWHWGVTGIVPSCKEECTELVFWLCAPYCAVESLAFSSIIPSLCLFNAVETTKGRRNPHQILQAEAAASWKPDKSKNSSYF